MYSVGNIIKIKPEIFSSDSLTDTFGSLGYVGLLSHALFKVTRLDKDRGRGTAVYAEIINPDKLKSVISGAKDVQVEGEWYLLDADVQKANTKITIDYQINEVDNTALVDSLFLERKKLRARGRDKKHPDMTQNWRDIRVARGEVKGSLSNSVDVYLPKIKLSIQVDRSSLPKEGDDKSLQSFKEILSSKVASLRSSRKKAAPIVSRKVYDTEISLSGGVHTSDGQYLKAYEYFVANAFDIPKSPVSKDATYLGIEIEMLFSGNMDLFRKLMGQKKLHRNVTITTDASVRSCHNQGYSGVELQVLCKTTEAKQVLQSLQEVFDHPSIDAYANRSCGLHVHGDMRNRDHVLVYKNLVRIQDVLRGSQPAGRVKNHHCRANTSDKFAVATEESRDARYWTVNPNAYKAHSTIEVRIHDGTVDCESIYNWVAFLDCIMSHKSEIPVNKVKTASEVANQFGISIPESAINYVDKRIARFKSLSAS
jgi:hypothetical protein